MAKHGNQMGLRGTVGLALAIVGLAGCVPGVKSQDQFPVAPPGESMPGTRGGSGPPPEFSPPTQSSAPVRPIIGGTLVALADARTAVAADPDRDKVFVVDYRKENVMAEIALQPGD